MNELEPLKKTPPSTLDSGIADGGESLIALGKVFRWLIILPFNNRHPNFNLNFFWLPYLVITHLCDGFNSLGNFYLPYRCLESTIKSPLQLLFGELRKYREP